jgi:thiazole/oxazole-forming peptide maturase SagC family component
MKQSILKIKRHFSIIPHSAQQVELRSGIWSPTSFVINDESNTNKLYAILKDLNGEHGVQDIAKRNNVACAEVESILDHLQQLNVLENSSVETTNYYTENLLAQSAATGCKMDNILIIGESDIYGEIKRTLTKAGIKSTIETLNVKDPVIKDIKANTAWLFDNFMQQETIEKIAWWKDYFIVLALTQNDPLLAMRINQINFTLGIPWIHGVIDGPFLFIGPTFISKAGPCYHCFEKRVTMNLHEYASYQRYKEKLLTNDISGSSDGINSPIMQLLAAHLSLEILNYQFSKTSFTKSKVLSMYLPTMEICFNEVLRLSGCPVCGAVAHRDDQQLYFDYQTLLDNPL